MNKAPFSNHSICESVVKFLIEEANRMYPLETGGILAGVVDSSRVEITQAIGPGKKAKHSHTKFKRDGDYSQQQLDKIVCETLGKSDYLGEWHTHPIYGNPSRTDLKSMLWVSNNSNYATITPIMLLLKKTKHKENWELAVFVLAGNILIPIPQAPLLYR